MLLQRVATLLDCSRPKQGGTSEIVASGFFSGETVLATSLWGMLYLEDTGVVSQSPEQLRKMMGVIVVVCAPFGLTVSEAKTDIMSLHTKGMPESNAIFSVEAAWPDEQSNERVRIPRGERQPQRRPVHQGQRAHTQRMVQLPEVHP